MTCGALGWKYLLVELVAGFPVVFHGFRALSWREPKTAFRAATALLYFTLLLSFSTWGLIWMG
jgi:hypothetical protein